MNRIFTIVLLVTGLFITTNAGAQVKKKNVQKTVTKKVIKKEKKPATALLKDMAQEEFTKVKITTNMGIL